MRSWLHHQKPFLLTFCKNNWHLVLGLCLGLALAWYDDSLMG